jgi:hypothetical protein
MLAEQTSQSLIADPGGYDERDIVSSFRALGRWAAHRQLSVSAIVGGSAAAILQTHVQGHAEDLDIYFYEVRNKTGKKLSHPERRELHEDAKVNYDGAMPIDLWFTELFDRTYSIAKENPAATPFASYMSETGHGLHVSLASIEKIQRGKEVRIHMFESVWKWMPDTPHLARQLDNFYGLSAMLGKNWDERIPAPRQADTLKRQAMKGPKPITFTAHML